MNSFVVQKYFVNPRYDFSIPEPRQTYIFVNLVRCTLTNIFAFHQIRFASCRNLHLKFHQHEKNVNNTTSSQRISTAPCGVAQHRYGLQRYVRWTRSVRVAKYKLNNMQCWLYMYLLNSHCAPNCKQSADIASVGRYEHMMQVLYWLPVQQQIVQNVKNVKSCLMAGNLKYVRITIFQVTLSIKLKVSKI